MVKGLRLATDDEKEYWAQVPKSTQFIPRFKTDAPDWRVDWKSLERNRYAPWGRGVHGGRQIA